MAKGLRPAHELLPLHLPQVPWRLPRLLLRLRYRLDHPAFLEPHPTPMPRR
jgi:hypothetical protein